VTWDARVEVETTTLDALIERFGMPAFVKIDVDRAPRRDRLVSLQLVLRRVVATRRGELDERRRADGGSCHASRAAAPRRRLCAPDRAAGAVASLMPRFDAAQVRTYYEQHTARFVALGQRGSLGSIHRALWGPGVTTAEQAFRYIEDRIADRIRQLRPSVAAPHVVDLGCGVGASLVYLAEQLPITGTGITLSPAQARIAARRLEDSGCAGRVRCIVGDYSDLPAGLAPADVAFAIESFVHGSAPDLFFAQCRNLIRPGGLLVICDDFRRPTSHPAAARTLERFRHGWRVNTLLSREELRSLAHDYGFDHEGTTDLTPYVQINRGRDRVVNALLALIGWLPLEDTRLGYLVGGSALQKALAKGWIGFDMASFRRRLDVPSPPGALETVETLETKEPA
jgi:cyclopropane fatty-acyl-phospholipid synthase-like methyltransferase